jgi:hypothetical protein
MEPLERLFALEVEFQRRIRTDALGTADAGPAHISYALQFGYERLLYLVGRVGIGEVDRVVERFNLRFDPRDVSAARRALQQILRVRTGGD